MANKATLDDLLKAAERKIERNDVMIYDVASQTGQIVGNVKHMRWFKYAVAQELIESTAKYAHLTLPE